MGSIYVQALGANASESQTTCAGVTTSATPINLAMVDLADGASMLASLLVVARRNDTGASKGWNGVALIKRVGAVVTVEEGTGGAPADDLLQRRRHHADGGLHDRARDQRDDGRRAVHGARRRDRAVGGGHARLDRVLGREGP